MTPTRRAWLARVTALVTIVALLCGAVGATLAAPAAVPHFGLTDDLAAYWTLDEAGGPRLDELNGCGGSGCDLTSNNGVGSTAGVVGNAATFNGTNQWLSHADHATLQAGDIDFTLAIWVKLNTTSVSGALFGKNDANNDKAEYDLHYAAGGVNRFEFGVSADGTITTTTIVRADNLGAPSAGVWYFVVAWHNAATDDIGISVNAGPADTASHTGGIAAGPTSFWLGQRQITDIFLDGALDEAGVWKRVLSPSEIAFLYSGGAGCTYPFASGCVAPTATAVALGGNLLRNPDFTTAPRQPASFWQDINRVVQEPYSDSGLNLGDVPYGSCGYEFWVMSRGANGDGGIWQDFGWTGGPMYLNFEAMTDSYATRGQATITNRSTGEEEALPSFTNGSLSWQSFKYVTGSKPAGQYRLGFSFDALGPRGGLAVDNVNLRRGYWGNDCPDENYHGQIPITANTTATPMATPTTALIPSNTPVNSNCDFEQGWAGYQHNAATTLATGGAVGPTYAYLYTIYDNGSDPAGVDIPGRLAAPFFWNGGMMYVSYWTGPGTRATVTIRNPLTGYSRQLQSATTVQTFGGWVKRSYGFNASQAGYYLFEAQTVAGQIAAFDGIAVSSGGFSFPCSTRSSDSENDATATAQATQTQIAATTTNQPGVILTANARGTDQADAYATYLAAQYATMTQNARLTQTQRPIQTNTQAAAQTATQAARFTATAQGTPVPTFTATPQPTLDVCVIDPTRPICVVAPVTIAAPNSATLTAIAAEQTQFANAAATFWAGAQQTQNARAQQTQQAAQTQTQAVGAPLTQQAAIQQTATARAQQTQNASTRATQTAIAGAINDLATQNALATQHAQQAAATETAVSAAATVGAGNSTQQAEATETAVAYATQYTGVTATAVAQRTADAIATVNYQSTQSAQATSNAIATAVVLATQHQQQGQATATAVALQTQLATQANPTANAQATTTAVVYATTAAQQTATSQAAATSVAATQVAEGTTEPGDGDLPPVDDRPEPQPGADCIRPDSPLQVSNWIDYEVCRVLTWFAWSPDNTDQWIAIQQSVYGIFPFGLLGEIRDVIILVWDWITQLPWCETGFCQDQPLAPLNIEATGLLTGDFSLLPGTPYYSDSCDLMLAPLVGPGIQRGACFCVNVLCALGILPWFQFLFNAFAAFALLMYVQRTWMTAAHT